MLLGICPASRLSSCLGCISMIPHRVGSACKSPQLPPVVVNIYAQVITGLMTNFLVTHMQCVLCAVCCVMQLSLLVIGL
jgi:hypothetical protein